MKKLIIYLAVIFGISSLASVAGVVFGTVKDENGNPIKGAQVKVYGKDIKTKTDEKGKFKIVSDKLIDGNRYSVRVEAEGYDSGQTLSTEIFDDPEEMEALDVVMYKAEPIPEPQTDTASTNMLPPGLVPPIQEVANETTNEIISIDKEVKEETPDIDIKEEKAEAAKKKEEVKE